MNEQKPRRRRIMQESNITEIEKQKKADEECSLQRTLQKEPIIKKKVKKRRPELIAAIIIEGLIIAILMLSIVLFVLNGWIDAGIIGFVNGVITTPTPDPTPTYAPIPTPTPTTRIEYVYITPKPTFTPTPTPIPTATPTPIVEYVYITPLPTLTPVPTETPTPIVAYVYITPQPTFTPIPKVDSSTASVEHSIGTSELLGIPDSVYTLPLNEEQNALRRAKLYLSVMPFSYTGLIEQLEYDGYSHEAAGFAANGCEVNWDDQAQKMAERYLNTMALSSEELVEQLEHEGFTHEQIQYALKQVGYTQKTPMPDWSAPTVYEKYVKDRVLSEGESSQITNGDDLVTGRVKDPSEMSVTEREFNYACNMTDGGDELVRVGEELIYGGFVVDGVYLGFGIAIDEEFVDYWNGEAVLGQDTLYKTMSKMVETVLTKGESAYKEVDEAQFERVFGEEKPSSYKKGIEYFKRVRGLMKSRDGSKGIFESFSKAKTISGYLDFENRNCSFTITNVTQTAKELGISETMLGYILAVFDAYAAEVEFSGYSCTVIREF